MTLRAVRMMSLPEILRQAESDSTTDPSIPLLPKTICRWPRRLRLRYLASHSRATFTADRRERGKPMTNPDILTSETILSDVDTAESTPPAAAPIDEKLQKAIDKALYANGNPAAQKIRNFLNGTWLGEPLHVVLTDIPVGAWTVAIMLDALDAVRNRRDFSQVAD